MKIEKIAIKFGDNDFSNTFEGVLKCLVKAHQHVGELNFTKKQLCELINNLSYPCYLLFQNQFSYNEESSGKPDKRTQEYLKINESKIMWNQEVDNYVAKTDWDNSETFILDLTQHEPYIYSL